MLKHYPYLIAEDADSAVGYTYAGKFRPREAYQRSVETSIYMRRDFRGKGVGRRMYNALAEILKLQNIYNMNACCAATPNPDDLYVPPTSIKFHERVGFKQVGRFSNCAYKFGNWYDMVWMERILMDHAENPNPGDFISLENVDPALIQEVLRNA